MARFNVERVQGYTVMSNYHLRDNRLSMKAKGLMSVMLSLPPEWDYSLRGLAAISRENVNAIGSMVNTSKIYVNNLLISYMKYFSETA